MNGAISIVLALCARLVVNATVTAGPPLPEPRNGHAVTLLPDHRVLISGGAAGSSAPSSDLLLDSLRSPLAYTLINPRQGNGAAAVLLLSGKVLVIGGDGPECALFDPLDNSWTPTGSLSEYHRWHDATLLPDGRAIVVGGRNLVNSTYLRTVEIYDPASETWTASTPLPTPWAGPIALLRTGKILLVGGENGMTNLTSCQLYDPVTGTARATGGLPTSLGNSELVMLPDGRIFATGNNGDLAANAWIYDPSTEIWQATAPMPQGYRWVTATRLLQTGKVMVAGGLNAGSAPVDQIETYDPATNSWSAEGDLTQVRSGQSTSVLFADGRIFMGGGHRGTAGIVDFSDVIDPNPVGQSRPTFQAAFKQVMPGQLVEITGSFGSSTPTAFFQPGSTVVNAYARTISSSANAATIEVPPVLFPGWYWLSVEVNGAHSVALPILVLQSLPDAGTDGGTTDGGSSPLTSRPFKVECGCSTDSQYGVVFLGLSAVIFSRRARRPRVP